VTSTPRKSHTSESPRRALTHSPGICANSRTTAPALSSSARAVPSQSSSRPSARAVKYVLAPQVPTPPRHNTAVISPMYTSVNTPSILAPTTVTDPRPFLATGLVCRKSPVRPDASPGLKASWIHIPTPYQTPPTGAIATAGAVLLLCGAVTTLLSMYMMSKVGEKLVVTQPVRISFVLHGSRKFLTVFTIARCGRCTQPIEPNPNIAFSLLSILIL
jgi:hypothetical protein